jgi:hypothetical protein
MRTHILNLRRSSLCIHAAGLAAALALSIAPVSALAQAKTSLFRTSDACMACHNGLSTPKGEDISIGFAWRSSMMGNAGRDPYWMAAVRREITEHPSQRAVIEDECSACHLPMTRFHAVQAGGKGQVFANIHSGASAGPMQLLAQDGVSCTLCHQITADKLGTRESFVAGFVIDTKEPMGSRPVFGPFDVPPGKSRIMRSSSDFVPTKGEHLQRSEICATCHTLFTTAFDAGGKAVGELPEQMPYLEWQHSAFRDHEGCQDCHMPAVREATPVSSVMGGPRDQVARHDFRGGNFFMPRLLNRAHAALGVTALPQELDATSRRAVELLSDKTARLTLSEPRAENGQLDFEVAVENLAGHKLPTGYPSRRAWLHVTVRDSGGAAIFESGALAQDGSIAGNDNDRDARSFEPHHDTITTADQVQIYETILGDPRDKVTTGLLTAVRYLKDNRLLPRGFDKTKAPNAVAVRGEAAKDDDFGASGDKVHFRIAVGKAAAPFQVEAELLYQPIAYRWAHNLGATPSAESTRFLSLWRKAADASATRIAVARAE